MKAHQNFGEYIRSLRLKRDMKQVDVCEKANIKTAYLSKIENNKSDPPSEEVLIRIATALGENPYRMLILAGKVPMDFQHVIVSDEEVFQYLEKKVRARAKAN
ncbi:helix-turn-helix domain-containing protein [Bacillus sp. FJAT-28004]|uniref:helix-turn-helix domain-containing protein n=1 Tax=Bacillus sp. FJAT-28004 TaxID=1679165 RepID=UPI0006B6876C|nr:helix-turn-helix transcriptional regulator [Bacillus sp. FJAT-28004]